jgi:hypothetical protein
LRLALPGLLSAVLLVGRLRLALLALARLLRAARLWSRL